MLQTSAAPKPTPSAGQMMLAYFKDFGVLKETRKEYWGIQVVNFLDCVFYLAMLEIATIFLSKDLGLTDKQAGFSYALFTSAISLLPYFLAKTGVSALSGYMLEYWSPETVPVNGVALPLQQALIHGQVPYWHSPAAMWLVLGAYAFAGCVIAMLLRGWLTRGAHWKPPGQTAA